MYCSFSIAYASPDPSSILRAIPNSAVARTHPLQIRSGLQMRKFARTDHFPPSPRQPFASNSRTPNEQVKMRRAPLLRFKTPQTPAARPLARHPLTENLQQRLRAARRPSRRKRIPRTGKSKRHEHRKARRRHVHRCKPFEQPGTRLPRKARHNSASTTHDLTRSGSVAKSKRATAFPSHDSRP